MSNLFNSFDQVSTLTEATVFPVVQNGQTRKATGLDLKNFVGGVLGADGATGPAGVDGATGATGPAGTSGVDGATGATGPAGATGAAGTSVKIVGSTSTASLLPFPYNGTDGDGYIVQDDGDLYVYASNTWTSVGQIVGPVGATGATGPAGLNTPATTSTLGGVIVGHNLSVTVAGTLSSITSVVGDAPPADPIEGDQWWDTGLGRSFTYFDGLWIETSPNVGAIGPIGSTGPQGATGATGPTPDLTNLSSHLVPSQDLTYDLGTTSSQWRSLYVGTSTVYFGGIPLRVTNEGGVVVNNIPLATGSGNTGDITFNGVKIIGAGTASGDGLGYSTLELVPDGTLNTDQYIVVDPTTPNHIHLRAGGTQDASSAVLFLGGELNYARVTDSVGIRLNNAQFIPDTVYFEQGVDYDTATWSTDESGNHWIDITISDPFNPTRDATPINTAGSRFAQYPTRNSIEVFTGSSLFTVTGNGQAYTLGNPYDYRIGTVEAPPANPTTLASLDYRLNTFNERYLYLENNALEAYADTVSVFSGQTIDLVTGVGNIRIATDDNNNSYSWYFTAQGYLQFPQGVAPTTSKGQEGDEVGSVVFDGTYIYYCTADYTDGVADIWKRVQWSNDTW